MVEQERANAQMKKRMLWLIPYNMGIIWATLRYCANIKNIANKFWPQRQKVRITNLLFVATIQAIGFTAFYIGGTLGILGVNPVAKYRELQQGTHDEMTSMTLTRKSGETVELNLTTRQKALVGALNSMGISND
eukprot:CAMPEP_0170504150 /NCGR_PEP_ID=MMETSP0208-20121228/47040_1 /TAXON_ID=197538 /ORGANISM="Strombidium inclinatum, Strain S3" /LENGTH=133 /DNA_ID=CAMNT_0010784239 /DNA_START=94 /DNA_END=492 /DNA_ORIENTATION=+